MIRYEFGEAPAEECEQVRAAVEHIAQLVPTNKDVTVHYPVDLPKQYENGKLMGFVDGRTIRSAPIIVEFSSMLTYDYQARKQDRNYVLNEMPMIHSLSPFEFVAAHEWAHVVYMDLDPTTPQFSYNASMLALEIVYNPNTDMSDYGLTTFSEALAEAFAEWHLSEGKTHNKSAKLFARVLNWRTDFPK